MKIRQKLVYVLAIGALTFGSCSYDDKEVWDEIHNLDDRLTKVEQALSSLNKEVNSMHELINELQTRPWITNYTAIENGMLLTFSDGRSITINNGLTPVIGENGNWWIGNKDTGVKAAGTDGHTPVIGSNGNWWIDGKDTGKRAVAQDGATPYIVEGYWWINGENTGVKAAGIDGQTPNIGTNGNWWIGNVDTGVKAIGETPYIGENGNWWIGNKDTGVKAAGTDGHTPVIGSNGNWWIGDIDTGVKAAGSDGATPVIGNNGNWWINGKDTGVKAEGKDGLTPYIGTNGNWWIGNVDTGVKAAGETETSIIGIEKGSDNIYYWTITVNGTKDYIYDDYGNKVPCSGVQPIFRTDSYNYLQYSVNYGVTWIYVLDVSGNKVTLNSGECTCTHFFSNVFVRNGYLHLILIDGTEGILKIANGDRGGIPEDPTSPSPVVTDPNTPIPYPSGQIETVDEWGNIIYSLTLSGITDQDGNWLKLFGTGSDDQNIWVDVDGSPKGILVINLEDNTSRVKNDIVFSVDNSGSMSEEADAIARDIMDLSTYLEGKGLDVKFSVVGYDGRLSGARNMCSASELSTYLSSNGTGTSRTEHFGGSDASALQTAASAYNNNYYECGSAAIQYANANFNFRTGSNRIYINFTDEPNQPNGKSGWSVDFFKSQTNWPAQYGTIHSVYSNTYTTYTETQGYQEYPWRMAEYTGGTKMFTSSSFTGVVLKDIPVMDAITHSYTIKMIIPESLLDGKPHTVVIKVISKDGQTRGVVTLTNYIFGLHK